MTDRLDGLERLVRLRDQGALTAAEFDAEKQRLIAGGRAVTMPLALEPARRNPLIPAATAGALVAIAAAGAGALFLRQPAAEPTPAPSSTASLSTPAVVAPATAPTLPSLTPAQARHDAFVAAFGYAPPRALTDDQRAAQNDDDGLFRPAGLVAVGTHFAVVAVHQGPSYHAASGAVEVRYVDRAPNGFHRFGSGAARLESGSFGEIGSWTVRRDLAANPMVAVKGGYSGMGCSTDAIGLIELTPEWPTVLAKSIIVDMDNSAEGNGPVSKWTAKLARSGEDIAVRYTGTKNRTLRFVRGKGDMKPQGAPPEGC